MWKWVRQEKPDETAILGDYAVVRPVVTLIEMVPGHGNGIRGKAHIIIDDDCYVVVMEKFIWGQRLGRFRVTPWIFKEAHEALCELPTITRSTVIRVEET